MVLVPPPHLSATLPTNLLPPAYPPPLPPPQRVGAPRPPLPPPPQPPPHRVISPGYLGPLLGSGPRGARAPLLDQPPPAKTALPPPHTLVGGRDSPSLSLHSQPAALETAPPPAVAAWALVSHHLPPAPPPGASNHDATNAAEPTETPTAALSSAAAETEAAVDDAPPEHNASPEAAAALASPSVTPTQNLQGRVANAVDTLKWLCKPATIALMKGSRYPEVVEAIERLRRAYPSHAGDCPDDNDDDDDDDADQSKRISSHPHFAFMRRSSGACLVEPTRSPARALALVSID